MTEKSDENRMGTGLGPYLGRIEDAMPVVRIHHDASYVTQLIAAAAGVPHMPRRRRLERGQAVSAYANADAIARPQPDRIARNA